MTLNGSEKPKRGEVWLVRYGAGEPGEPTKNRPGVVVGDPEFGTGSIWDLCVVVPLSASVGPSLSRPVVASEGSGLNRQSVALVSAMRGVSPKRLLKHLGQLDDQAMDQIGRVLPVVLGL